MRFPVILSILFCLALASCDTSDKEKQLQQRETELRLREEQFASMQQDYESLKALRDSLRTATDSVAVTPSLPENFIGKWNGKMICTESNCSEHVIGDQRSDSWIFSSDSLKIINKTGGERAFSVKFQDTEIKLLPRQDALGSGKAEITLQINPENPDRLKGIREFSGKDCMAKFSVELEKNKK